LPDGRRFENVDLLRGLAACAVMAFHVVQVGWKDFPEQGIAAVVRYGWAGVDLFFVISGFVIGRSAFQRWRASPGTFARVYWRHRLLRIVPLYLVLILVWVAAFPAEIRAQGGPIWWHVATHVAFVHSWWPNTLMSIDGPTWSLAIEMQFYLLAALFVSWLSRVSPWKLALGAFVVACAWRAFAWTSYAGNPDRLLWLTWQLPGALDEFAAGLVLARLTLDRPAFTRRETAAWMVLFVVAGGLALVALAAYSQVYWQTQAMVILFRILLAVAFMALVAAAVALPQAWSRTWLAPLHFLGRVSYGIYLWHLFVIAQLSPQVSGPALMALAFAFTIFLAWLSWRLIEEPALALARSHPQPTSRLPVQVPGKP